MFKTRLFSGIILVALMLLFIIPGGNLLLLGVAFLALVAMMEILRVAKLHKSLPGLLGYGAVLLVYVFLYLGRKEYMVPLIVFYLIALMAVYVVTFPKYKTEQILYPLFGFFYAGYLISYLYQVRELPGGAFSVWLIFIAAWGSDTCAYCVGMLFGKHKAFPVLSPKKSWEGCVGGVVGAALIAVIYCFVMNHWFGQSFSAVWFALVCACGSVISQVGDLAASAIKRNNDIKDYGKLIPGHGGVLDRYDSIIFVAPLVYYLLQMTL